VTATGGQHPASPGGLHSGAKAVFPAAVPLLGLISLLHRKVSVSPFGLGVRIPRKARERAVRTKALWRVCRRIICTARSECQTIGSSNSRPRPDSGPIRPILPGSIRFETVQSLPEPLGRCYSSAARGARQPWASAQEGTVRTARLVTKQSLAVGAHGATKAIVDPVSVSNLAIHSSLLQD
jgi:hypothetical protein